MSTEGDTRERLLAWCDTMHGGQRDYTPYKNPGELRADIRAVLGAAPLPAEQEPGAPAQNAGAGGISNPRDVPGAQSVIHWLCELQGRVASHLGYDHPADCFCGDSGYWPLKRAEDYRNDGKAVAFIEAATLKALSASGGSLPDAHAGALTEPARKRPRTPVPPGEDASGSVSAPAGSLSDTRTEEEQVRRALDRLADWDAMDAFGAVLAARDRLVAAAGAANTERDERECERDMAEAALEDAVAGRDAAEAALTRAENAITEAVTELRFRADRIDDVPYSRLTLRSLADALAAGVSDTGNDKA